MLFHALESAAILASSRHKPVRGEGLQCLDAWYVSQSLHPAGSLIAVELAFVQFHRVGSTGRAGATSAIIERAILELQPAPLAVSCSIRHLKADPGWQKKHS